MLHNKKLEITISPEGSDDLNKGFSESMLAHLCIHRSKVIEYLDLMIDDVRFPIEIKILKKKTRPNFLYGHVSISRDDGCFHFFNSSYHGRNLCGLETDLEKLKALAFPKNE